MTEYNNVAAKQMLSDSKFYSDYSRWIEDEGRYETWGDSVDRVMNMHREKYKDILNDELEGWIKIAQSAYKDKLILGAQRALQFGGEQVFKHEMRLYNCASHYADRSEFFQETMYMLLCGAGVGFSVQRHHVAKIPQIHKRSLKKVKVFTVPDTIEGWADAYGVLLSSYYVDNAPFPEYKGYQVHFDFSKIRPKGAMISGGFKAPGPDGLRKSLIKCEELIEAFLQSNSVVGSIGLSPITVYDFVMHMSDAVLSGGVRRSATICLFDKDDQEMLNAKTGNWHVTNPQRGRSNNSAILVRDDLTREEWHQIMQSVKDAGEPGFIFTDSTEFTFNPCVEIGMLPVTEDGRSGVQVCNLAEINGGMCKDEVTFYEACISAAIMCTLQAGYTNFKYLGPATKEITDREALIGVSITGWMNNPNILFDERILKKGAEIVKKTNAKMAKLLGINPAARATCAKPAGNASVILNTASGIHGEHSERYFRNTQMNTQEEVMQLIAKTNPAMIEKSVWSANGTDVVVSFPVITNPDSIFKSELLGIKQLEYVRKAQQTWVEYGTNVELCRDSRLRHNVSNTITVDDWDEVEEYLYENRKFFAGVSLMAAAGDKAYAQAPFTEVRTANDILTRYGTASMFASGLIVDALHAFDNNLWLACSTLEGSGLELGDDSVDLLKRDWIRRANKFANSYFEGNVQQLTFLLKDCYNLHKWEAIMKNLTPIDFAATLSHKKYTEVDTMGAQACAGGSCEVSF